MTSSYISHLEYLIQDGCLTPDKNSPNASLYIFGNLVNGGTHFFTKDFYNSVNEEVREMFGKVIEYEYNKLRLPFKNMLKLEVGEEAKMNFITKSYTQTKDWLTVAGVFDETYFSGNLLEFYAERKEKLIEKIWNSENIEFIDWHQNWKVWGNPKLPFSLTTIPNSRFLLFSNYIESENINTKFNQGFVLAQIRFLDHIKQNLGKVKSDYSEDSIEPNNERIKLKWNGSQSLLFSVLRQLKNGKIKNLDLLGNSYDDLGLFLVQNFEGYEKLKPGSLSSNMAKNIDPQKANIKLDLTDSTDI